MAKYEDILEEIRKRTELANTNLNNVQDAINYGQSNGRSYESLDTQLKNSRAITRDYAANLKRIADRNNIAYSNTEELTPTLSSLASKNINKKAWEQDSKLPTNIVDIAKRNEQELQNEKKRFNETIGNTQEYKDYQYRINKLNPTLRYARDVAELNEKGVSGLDKVFSPLMSGLDNIKTSGTFKQDNNSRIMLPTLNDLKTQKATENANWLYKGYADISQSVGNMLPGIAASAINPALGSALFFGNTYQNARNQALLEGYDESSASNYGVINATLELGVGKVLGGTTALLGKSPVSKLLGDKITSKLIVNPAINSAISDMMSEFGEEYIQEWLDPKVKAYILDKKDLADAWESSKFFDKQNFYAGLLGALSAGITNTPGTIRQNSALNSEFEKIVDTLQKDGNEKLTNEQLKQLKKTYYKEYNKALKNDTEIDYENISDKLSKGIRTEQSLTNDIEQLKEQQKQTTDNKLKQELATRISGLEQELNQFKLPMASTEGMTLQESASKYNIKPETQSAVQQLMENRGIESRWDSTKFNDNSVNALWTKDANGNRQVIFNPNASLDTIVEEVAMHELTHDILSSENTTLNAQEVLDYVKSLDGYYEARQSLENTYSTMYDPNSAEFNSLIDEEVVADVLGRKLGNQEFINQLVNSKPSIAKSIYNWVVSKLNSIVNRKGIKNEKLYWQNIKNNFEKAYKQEYQNNEMASTKYKVSDTSKENAEWNEFLDKNITKDNQGNEVAPGMQKYMSDSKARVDEDLNKPLVRVYHTMTDMGVQFNEFNPVGTDYYKFGDQVVNYYTNSKKMSASYADGEYEMADTKKITNLEEAQELVKAMNKGYASENTIRLEKKGKGYELVNNIYKEAYDYAKSVWENEITPEEKEIQKQYSDLYKKYVDSGYDNNAVPEFTSLDKFAPEYSKKIDEVTDKMSSEEKDAFLSFRNPDFVSVKTDPVIIANYNNDNELFRNLKQDIQKADSHNRKRYQYEGYVNITNPYVIDAEGRNWNKVESKKDSDTTTKLLSLDTLTKDRLSQLAFDSKKRYEETYKEWQKWNDAKNSISGSLRDENSLNVRMANRFIEESTLPLVKEFVSNNYRTTLDTFVEDYQSLQEKDSLEKTHEWRVNTDIMYNLYNNDFIPYSMYNEFNNTLVVPEEARKKAKEIINQEATYNEYDSEGHNPEKKQAKLVDIWEKYVDSYKAYENNGRYDYSLFDSQLLDGYLKEDLDSLFPIKEPGIGINYDYLKDLYKSASHNFDENYIRLEYNDWSVTNDIVKSIIDLNKVGENYDGVIIKNVVDYGGYSETHEPADLYITFASNQFKAADNETPTEDADIRYSKQSEEWDKWNNKTIAPEGTKTKLKDIKLPKKEINLPKSTQVKQETRQEVKLPTRETITKEELEELDSLKALNEITDLSREEQQRLDYLEKKQQGYTERYPGLKKVSDFKEISREYGKYRDLEGFDRTLLRDAESMIKGYRNTERRTKEQWLSIARYIGSNFKGNSEELQKYAIQSWFAAAPNQKGSLNRQGKGFVDFKIQEWINSMYDGARVGELDKPSTPKKQTILPMAREDNVLKVNANEIADFMNGINGNQRKWIGTSTESDVLKDKVLIKDLDASKLNYVVESNQKSVDTANNHLNTYGYEKSLEDVKSLLRSDKLPKASDVALAERVLQEAVKNGDTKTAQDLIMDIAILGTDLGQATQALSIIKRLTPEGQLSMYTKMIQRAKSRGEKSFENVEITPEMVEMVLNAYKSDGTYDQEDLNTRVENFKQEIANQMKTTTGEKINAWRYLAMLGNPKTHIRNIVSNVAMNGTIKVKNAMARTLESVLPIKNRTKTWKKASNFIKNYAETTANEMKGIITGENKYNEKSSIESKKQIFKNKTLEKISDFNSNALEAEDWFFSKRAFISNLEEYLTANGINTQEDIESRPEVVEKAKNYAKEQAEIATFRQYSKLAAQINNLEKNNKLARFFIEATVPFKKTPINVAKAGVKYSPLGLIKSLSYDIYQVRQGNMEASQFIDNLSQSLTGTSLAILGYALAKNGILNGGGDDDKEGKYDTQLGDNQYSLKIGDKSYSISWLSPVAMPLLVGANAFEQLEEKEEWDMNVVSETLAKTLDPLNEMSFMQGLTNALSSYDKGVEKLAGIGESVAQNYVGQFFPTIFSQFASTIDDKKRSTKASANSTYKFGEQTLRSIMYKLPGLRQQLEVATDVWGNEKEQADNIIQRAYESFLAPYSTTKNITSDLDKEIKSIYNKTNETGVIPSVPYSYIKYKDETYRMSANEYTKYKKTFGQNANKYLNNLISSNSYKNASDDDKAKMIKNTYDYAKAEANEEYFKSQSIDYTSDTLKELNLLKKIGIDNKSLSEYISNKTLASTIKSDNKLTANEKHEKIAENLINSKLNDKQLAYLYGKYYSTDDKLNNLVELNIPIKEFIKLNSQDIESDYNERTGKTISNSKKNKVINYVNSLNLSIPQKAILIKSQYNTYKNYDNQIVNYVNNLNKSVNDKKVILKSIGFDNYDNDVINYINSQNMSIKDKEKKLKSLGFTIRNGRVYK